VRPDSPPDGKIELYSETFLAHGYRPLPEHEEPLMGPRSRPELAKRFPLILTCANPRSLREPAPRAAQPAPARPRSGVSCIRRPRRAGIRGGDWVAIETPEGQVRARAKLNESLDPRVVCGQHGWWQAVRSSRAPAYDPFGPDGANYNSSSVTRRSTDQRLGPHRAYLCQIRRAD